jgi:isoleucyl-tRNA synthetase
MFLAVNENIDYCDVQFNDETYVVAVNLVKNIFHDNYKILRTFKGKELINLKYKRPIDFIKLPDNTCVIVHGQKILR